MHYLYHFFVTLHVVIIQRGMFMIVYTLIFGLSFFLGLNSCRTVSVNRSPETIQRLEKSPNYRDGKFHNLIYTESLVSSVFDLATDAVFEASPNCQPKYVPKTDTLSFHKLLNTSDNSNFAIWLGHSTVLLKIKGKYILTDPIFSTYPSPIALRHLHRFHPNPISIEDIPFIDFVIISHDHYDHLDRPSIEKLKDKTGHFITPLAVGDYLREWGVENRNITELDWWESVNKLGLQITATPARHGSGRGLTENNTLWASYVIHSSDCNIFYSGDTGLMPAFKEIGEIFGPFDLTMIQLGAYSDNWPYVHMTPEEAIELHKMVYGNMLLPVHWGTFNLAYHAWDEPLQRAKAAAKSEGICLIEAMPGEIIEITPTRSKEEIIAERETEALKQ